MNKKLKKYIIIILVPIILVIAMFIFSDGGMELAPPRTPEQEREHFNSKFAVYGEEQTASVVKVVVMHVAANNIENSERIITLYKDGIESSSRAVQEEVEGSSKVYNIKVDYDEDGYVNKVMITEL